MSDMLEQLWAEYLNRFNERWNEAEQQWREALEYPEAVIHCDDEGVQRVQFGMGAEHLATDDPVNLGDWE